MTVIDTLSRRNVLRYIGAGAALGALGGPRLALADVATDKRLVVVVLRGAMDGLAVVPPYGDRRYQERRASLALPMPGETGGIVKLDSTFGLNAELAVWAPLWSKGELAVVPATFGGYHTRSHFDAQDMLETGLTQRSGASAGWLNRALAVLPAPSGRRLGLALGDVVPLTLRGPVPVASWAPPNIREASPALLNAVAKLYQSDPLFGPALADGIKAQHFSDTALADEEKPAAMPNAAMTNAGPKPGAFAVLAQAAGGLLAAPDGPRVAVLDIGGWDTHVGQGTVKGRLATNLAQFVAGMEALRTSLGSAWGKTLVVCVTEFGRTVAPNGTNGTDHGTASMTLVLGGAARGGRIAGDWPGLDQLEENRDLRTATDIRAVLKGALGDHLGLDRDHLDNAVFPGSASVKALSGLVRA